MQNIKLLIEYDGTNYTGFQIQRQGEVSIQLRLEEAIEAVAGERPKLSAAGRTDAGVHALGQVVNFLTQSSIPLDRWPYALNTHLPPDIVVWGAEEVPPDFHARKSARSKVYRYTIYNAAFPSPLWRLVSYHWRDRLDEAAMNQAAAVFAGRHDFAGFRTTGSSARTTVRTVMGASVERDGHLVHFTVEADGFLYNMVRIMAGTLLEVGSGKVRPEEIPEILASKDRRRAGRTLPPQGLCLVKVRY